MENKYNVFEKKKQMRGKDRSKKSTLRASRDKVFYAYHAYAKNISEAEIGMVDLFGLPARKLLSFSER